MNSRYLYRWFSHPLQSVTEKGIESQGEDGTLNWGEEYKIVFRRDPLR